MAWIWRKCRNITGKNREISLQNGRILRGNGRKAHKFCSSGQYGAASAAKTLRERNGHSHGHRQDQRRLLWQDAAQEFCPAQGNPGDAQPAGGAEALLPVVPGHGAAGGVQGRLLHHRLRRESGALLYRLLHGRGAQVQRGGVQGPGRHLRRADQGQGAPAQQRDRGDEGTGDLHGRFPDHDQGRHLCHQRRRARHRLPAGPLPGYLLLPHRGQGGYGGLRLHRDSLPGRLAGV